MEIKEIVRKIGDKEYKGTLTKDGNRYIYNYPYAKEVGDKMTDGDIIKIASICNCTPQFVAMVLRGSRWNETVLREAQKFADRNAQLGFKPLKRKSKKSKAQTT